MTGAAQRAAGAETDGTPGLVCAAARPVRGAGPDMPAAEPFDLQRFAGERTLPATPRKRQKARDRGQLGKSAELAGAAGLMAAALALRFVAVGAAQAYAAWASALWGHLPGAGLDQGGAGALLITAVRSAAAFALPVLATPMLAAAFVGAAQTGAAFAPSALAPDFSRVNPLQGLQRMFSRRSLVELAKSLLKFLAVAAVAVNPCLHLVQQAAAGSLGLAAVAGLTLSTSETVLLRTGLVLLLAGVADLFYQRYETDVTLRMTSQELREETRESEGDPALRARRRRRAREMSRRRMLADVRRADVVLANPTHYAVALRYDPERMAAPAVVAKGVDFMAGRIRAVAAAAGVPIVENPPLARSLYAGVKVGQAIPAGLYQAVAEVLAFVWRVRGRL